MRKIIACLTGFVLASLLLSASAHAATPAAGLRINNHATATFFDTNAGYFSTLNSNTVVVIVQPVEAVQIRPAQTFNRTPGSTAVLPYRVTNSGNVTATYALTFSNAAGDNFDLTGLTLYRDTNGNGVVDTVSLCSPQAAPLLWHPAKVLTWCCRGKSAPPCHLGKAPW